MVYELDRRWVVETRWENLDDEHVYGGVLSWRLAWYRPDSSIHREDSGAGCICISQATHKN